MTGNAQAWRESIVHVASNDLTFIKGGTGRPLLVLSTTQPVIVAPIPLSTVEIKLKVLPVTTVALLGLNVKVGGGR